EVKLAMEHLKRFHSHRLKGYKKFDLRERIAAYEKSLKHNPSDFLPNYDAVKKSVLERLSLVEKMEKECILSHIDSVHENFIINKDKIRLIDWEYASECDPHIDIAMFCIYAYYDKNQIDSTIDLYFGSEACPQNVREKIYHYVAISGFLWALWCEIKRDAGVLYEDYEKIQYAYAL
ncbi:MAG: phosphotransferase, partial [Treponema sp.]|nr:phosphotransferase [Treponema sp.]